eukprot:TRINITY_DN32497_c0_g1_i1.p1 TRINITY_DN32497_c0_g1~~TRINITY_DN32497_c0_g1_i1.p1  ORF type:complete len:865 (+),score=208.52 TRINITY_DN32497_c0_g1_i1:80-2674(+)
MTTTCGVDRRSFLVGPGQRVLGPPRPDGLGSRYGGLVNDERLSASKREAFGRVVAAEARLEEAGDGMEALQAAQEALRAARQANDPDIQADCQRLVLKAQCLRAQHLASGAARDMGQTAAEAAAKSAAAAQDLLQKSERLAENEAAVFAREGSSRGEALMLLSQADLRLHRGGLTASAAALELATEAQGILAKLDDTRSVALAQETRAAALLASGRSRAAQTEAEVALSQFHTLGDKKHEAHALHLLALTHALRSTRGGYEEAVRFALDALHLYRELGQFQRQCSVELSIARLSLERERPEQALQAASEAVAMIREFGGNADLERLAWTFWVQAHLDDDEEDAALQVAREAVYRFKEQGNLKQQALMLDTLAGALLAVGCATEARAQITAALELSRTAKNLDLEAILLLRFSTAHGHDGDEEEALQAAEDALAIWEASEEDCSEEVACARYRIAQLLLPRFDPKDTMKEVSMARSFFSHAQDSYREAHLLLFIANVTLLGGDVNEAAKTLHVAKETFREAEDPRGEARALGLSADLCLQQGKYQEAMDMSQRRRATAQEAGWAVEEVKALSVISDVARSLEDPKTAARAAREGMRMAKSLGNKKEQVQLMLQAVQCNIQLISSSGGPENASRNMMEETQRLARDAVLLTTQEGPPSGWRREQRPSALFWQAQVLAMTSLEDAMAVLGQADELCREVGAHQVRAHCLILGAQLQLHQNNKEKAEAMLMPAIELLEQIGDPGGVQYAREILQKAAGVQAAPSPQVARIEAPTSAESKAFSPETAIVKKLDVATVREQVMRIARDAMATDEDVHDDTPLMDSGMDSLTSVSFRNEVAAAFGASLPASLIFDYPSIGEITRYVVDVAS